jgi:hypothetical protein
MPKVATIPDFNPSILRHIGIWMAAEEAVMDKVRKIFLYMFLAGYSVLAILYF